MGHCATQDCHARIPSSDHQECLRYASCTLCMQFKLVNCLVCSLAVAELLRHPVLTEYEPQLHLICRRWQNL